MTQKTHPASYLIESGRREGVGLAVAREHREFFARLIRGAGRSFSETAVAAAVEPMIAEPTVVSGSQLADVCRRLGLTLQPIRLQIDEAVGLIAPRRPVLLELQKADGIELVAIHYADGMTVRVDALNSTESSTEVMPRALSVEKLADGNLVAAHRVGLMGEADSSKTPPPKAPNALRRLLWLLSPDRTEILIVFGFAVGLGVLALATPIAVQALVNFVAFGGLIQPLIVVGTLLLFFLAFAGAIRAFKSYVVEILQRRVFTRVVSDLSVRLPRVRFDAHDQGYGPETANRFFDVMTIQKMGSTLLIDGLDIMLQAGIGLIVLGFYHPMLLVFDILLIAVILFIVFGLGRGAVTTARKESSAKYAVAAALEELARAHVTYKLTGASEYAHSRLASLTGQYIQARRKQYAVVFRQLVGAVTLHAVAATALLTLGGFLVISGELTLGQLVAAELIVSVALASVVKFGKQFEATYDLLAGVDKLGVLFDLPVEDETGEPHMADNSGARLELREVSYRYPNSLSAFARLSLVVESKERVAVRGPRGSGKSTFAELITGLRKPSEGVVLLDGSDLRGVARSSIRTQIDLIKGVEPVAGSVVDNMRLGRSGISSEDLRNALARLGILNELLELPDGLRTEISADGVPLSRTTMLMLMIARMIVGRPRAVVIDSILDELDEASLARALAILIDPAAPWTLLVFTSRDEVCAAMDRVVELIPPAGVDGGPSR